MLLKRASIPLILVEQTVSKSSGVFFSINLSARTPAPWINPVTVPNFLITGEIAALSFFSSVTSTLTYSASPPAFFIRSKFCIIARPDSTFLTN